MFVDDIHQIPFHSSIQSINLISFPGNSNQKRMLKCEICAICFPCFDTFSPIKAFKSSFLHSMKYILSLDIPRFSVAIKGNKILISNTVYNRNMVLKSLPYM